MLSVEEEAVMHMLVTTGDYNPAKAHEYYMRTRQLTPRQPAAQQPTVGVRTKAAPVILAKLKPRSNANVKVVPKMTALEVKAKVQALQKRLAILKLVLAELVKQAKARNGVGTKSKVGTNPAVSTSVQKKAAAKSSAKYYDKNKAAILAKAKAYAAANNITDLEAQIKTIQEKIAKMRADLAAAIKQ